MIRLDVWLDRDHVGWLSHESATGQFAFEYSPAWTTNIRAYPLSPNIPLQRSAGQTAETHSAAVRLFFENLLPEGESLEVAAQVNGVSRGDLVGLLVALAKETAGALRVSVSRDHDDKDISPHDHEGDGTLRLITREELSSRIRKRPDVPFSVWDGKVRLSIAGFQDKIAVYERDDNWYLVEGSHLASTVIVKPQPVRARLAGLPENEFVCMQLAQRVGVAVANTRLVHLPEPVLLVTRFDRVDTASGVRRLHIIDGCQALGLAVSMKYERQHGDGPDVIHYRDGVSLPKLFRLLDQSPHPALSKTQLLRWTIFQILIGNTDAHGKNISLFFDVQGLRLAPAYDMVCAQALTNESLVQSYAMAVGDAFSFAELTAFSWASFAKECDLRRDLVSMRIRQLCDRTLDQLPTFETDMRLHGVSDQVLEAVLNVVANNCASLSKMALATGKVPAHFL